MMMRGPVSISGDANRVLVDSMVPTIRFWRKAVHYAAFFGTSAISAQKCRDRWCPLICQLS